MLALDYSDLLHITARCLHVEVDQISQVHQEKSQNSYAKKSELHNDGNRYKTDKTPVKIAYSDAFIYPQSHLVETTD